MKWSILILALFTASFCKGQDSIVICKEKNLLVPEEYFDQSKYKDLIYKDLVPKCENKEVILTGYDYLFTGFEKYGYILEMDTTNSNIDDLGAMSRIVGYFDLVNNTDSIINVCRFGWSIDNSAVYLAGDKPCVLKPGESTKVKFILFKGLYRIGKADFDTPLIPAVANQKFISSKKKYIEEFDFLEKLKCSNTHFYFSNRLTIGDNNFVHVMFMIPIKYIVDIKYY